MARITRPREDEPIRLVFDKQGRPRFRVTLDVAPKGAPRKQITATRDSLAAARTFVTETRARLAEGDYTQPSKVTLETLATDWLASKRDVREVTRSGYADALAPVLDRLGRRAAQSITRRDVEGIMEALATEGGRRGRPLSHRSLVYALGSLRQCLQYGVSTDVLRRNVAADVKPRRKRKGDSAPVQIWEPGQLLAFRSHVTSTCDDWAHAAFMLATCGLRRSEVLGLRWSSVDLDAGTVLVESSRVKIGRGGATSLDDTKSDASTRTVAAEVMAPGTVAALRSLRARQAADRLKVGAAYEDTGLVIVNALGQGIHPETYALRWRSLRTTSGLPVIRLHALRHSLATLMHRAGVAPADAAAVLGHTVATHLAFYVKPSESGAASAAAAVGEVFAAAR
ncbi:site-specific integrase [Nocardioides carbamazepini]|uniref:site-specific integrase n=1 Tax=Nocardioides carbamazepini TaxID=2854259 RepID=UPI00214A82D0|nr:site-specific integrase [Nocardioides carbamazepini]MCR1784103.1 site-specific integrase [Nocardioides carbamazepini]